MKKSFFSQISVSLKSLPALASRAFINKSSFLLCVGSFCLLLSACQESGEATLDTGRLSDSCRKQLVPNEYIIKFKHEGTYRTINADNPAQFLKNIVQPMEDQVESYGLNFKLPQQDSLVRLQNLNKAKRSAAQPWVKTATRSEFLNYHGYFGQGVKVAVLDTGIDLNNLDLQNNLLRDPVFGEALLGFNAAENNNDVQDFNGHGTMVSALIASPATKSRTGEDFEGGLAPQAQILPVKIFARDSRTTDLSTVLRGLNYAIEQKVHIINASWGGSEDCSPLLENKLFEVWANNILFVTSAGDKSKNLTHTPDFPASFNIPAMVVVSGINKNLEIPSRANIGGLVNLFAPSQDVPTLGLNQQLEVESGTSLASAIASGGAALLRSAFPYVALHTLSYALTHGSSIENPNAELNIMDLKSSYFYLQSQQITPQIQP